MRWLAGCGKQELGCFLLRHKSETNNGVRSIRRRGDVRLRCHGTWHSGRESPGPPFQTKINSMYTSARWYAEGMMRFALMRLNPTDSYSRIAGVSTWLVSR